MPSTQLDKNEGQITALGEQNIEVRMFGGLWNKSLLPIFNPRMLIQQSKLNIKYKKILIGKITHYLDPEIRKMPVMCSYENEYFTFDSGWWFIEHEIINLMQVFVSEIEFKG